MNNNRNNLLLKGLSGKIKQLLSVKHSFSKTGRPAYPQRQKIYNASKLQPKCRQGYATASSYARKALKKSKLKTAYEKLATTEQSAFAIAVKDYMTEPILKKAVYTKNEQNTVLNIDLAITDVLEVKEVVILFYSTQHQLLEEGLVENDKQTNIWHYHYRLVPGIIVGKIVLYIYDTPGTIWTKLLEPAINNQLVPAD